MPELIIGPYRSCENCIIAFKSFQ